MTPTYLELAVAIVLLWVAWRIALILRPLVLKRIRDWRNAPSRQTGGSLPPKTIEMVQKTKDEKS